MRKRQVSPNDVHIQISTRQGNPAQLVAWKKLWARLLQEAPDRLKNLAVERSLPKGSPSDPGLGQMSTVAERRGDESRKMWATKITRFHYP